MSLIIRDCARGTIPWCSGEVHPSSVLGASYSWFKNYDSLKKKGLFSTRVCDILTYCLFLFLVCKGNALKRTTPTSYRNCIEILLCDKPTFFFPRKKRNSACFALACAFLRL
ncbi:hypothetical protein VTO42DRAFT_1551 [Malbranchea cinnamomea]